MTTFVSRRRIAGAGFAATDLAARTALIDRAESALRGATGAPPQWAWFVPGRIEVLGKHTDYAGGASLVAAVPRGFAVAATPRDDGTIAVTDARWATQAVIEPGTTGDVRGWARYVAVVARRFADNFPGASLGVDVAIASDLPRAAGLSSSSALIVAMALVLARRGRLDTRPEWREAIRTPLDLAAYLGAVEAGRGFRGLRAAGGVGTKGGSEDHTAILASAPERLRAFTCLPMQALGEAAMPTSWTFVVMTSGVHADKAGRVRGQYNRAADAVAALVELWQQAAGSHRESLAAILAGERDGSRLRELVVRSTHPAFTREELEARLAHFIAEHARVCEALEAFRTADRDRLGELTAASQADAERLLGNQVPATMALTRAARQAGAFAATSFGAGFGGSVWALVEGHDVESFAREWECAYRASMLVQGPLEWFAARPAPPAFEVEDI